MARVLAKRNIAKAIRGAQQKRDGQDPPDDHLPDGFMHLYSFYTPALEAGPYAVEAKQMINLTDNSDSIDVWNYMGKSDTQVLPVKRQIFVVAAPQFNIASSFVNTCYPPPGHQDEGRILPHVVFNDPHVPWMRRAGIFYDFLKQPFDNDPDGSPRSMVPWMALLVFSPDELLVSGADATATGLSNIESYIPTKLPSNGAFPMTVANYMSTITRRVYYEAAGVDGIEDPTEMTSIIFPKKGLIQSLLGTKEQPDILKGHRLMAHVRHINTQGFPDAGMEEDGYFSVVVSSRTGDVKSTIPSVQIVHLVSLEHYDSTVNKSTVYENLGLDDRFGMVSLMSWTYTCIPEVFSFRDTVKNLGGTKQPLRPPDSVLAAIKMQAASNKSPALQKAALTLYDRLSQSYTISRWRTASGEETAAFTRGPLVAAPTPIVPAADGKSWPAQSMTGKDYQIFDLSISMMDLTYSSAWSLGRIAAISDSAFNAALLRFRSLIHKKAASHTRMLTNGILRSREVLARVAESLDKAADIDPRTFSGPVQRHTPPSTDPAAPPLNHPSVAPIFVKAVRHLVDKFTSVADGKEIYNDYNLDSAANSDWELIHSWLSDCLYLRKIPAHYLFSDLSHINSAPMATPDVSLPNVAPEALRFFYIDNSWLDAFIDGALSCCNHLQPNNDTTRMRIKDAFNFYLSTPIHGLETRVAPVPRYGFVLRSLAVKATPDIKITVFCWRLDPKTKKWSRDEGTDRRDPVVLLNKLDEFTLLCLVDCLPEEICEVRIAQPPHQQRFAMGAAILQSNDYVPELDVRMMYTSSKTSGIEEDGTWPFLKGGDVPTDEKSYYDPTTRVIHPDAIASSVVKALLNSSDFPGLYTDPIANSCILGVELNDDCYTLIIHHDPPQTSIEFPAWTRELWTGTDATQPRNPSTGPALEDLPRDPLIEPKMIQVVATTDEQSSTRYQRSIRVPSPPALHTSRVIPITSPALLAASGSKAIEAPSGPAPLFKVKIHVDYRPAPPTAHTLGTSDYLYAPLDYLPTDTPLLYDLIVSISRIDATSTPGVQLASLEIHLPQSDGAGDRDGAGNIVEPLLPKEDYSGPGARMVSNLRFVSTMTRGVDARTGKPYLGITLLPRSGAIKPSILVDNDDRTTELNFRLAECPIAPILNTTQILVASVGGGVPVTASVGVCKFRMIETYYVGDDKQTLRIETNGDLNSHNHGPPAWALKMANKQNDMQEHGFPQMTSSH